MKYKYTCSDTIKAMKRDAVIVSVPSMDDAFSLETWAKVKRTFARRYHTNPDYVGITGTEQLEED